MGDDKKKYDFAIEDSSKVFFTSDLHAYHTNIIESCRRPFKDAEEMNEVLIENWNAVVDDDSVVFCLGDFAWGGYTKWKNFCDKLNGKIVLIVGNHDRRNLTSKAADELFDFVTQQMYLRIEGRPVYLNHYPFLCYGGIYREPKDQVWALHGHIHLGPNSLDGKDIPRMKYLLPTQYDVGVDMNNFAPISWEEIKNRIEYQVENNVNCLCWIPDEKLKEKRLQI